VVAVRKCSICTFMYSAAATPCPALNLKEIHHG
jgi:hypothetical protein